MKGSSEVEPGIAAEAPRKPRANRGRQQRYEQRKRAGVSIIAVPVELYELTESLIESGRITVADALERDKVAHAVAEVVHEWSERWR